LFINKTHFFIKQTHFFNKKHTFLANISHFHKKTIFFSSKRTYLSAKTHFFCKKTHFFNNKNTLFHKQNTYHTSQGKAHTSGLVTDKQTYRHTAKAQQRPSKGKAKAKQRQSKGQAKAKQRPSKCIYIYVYKYIIDIECWQVALASTCLQALLPGALARACRRPLSNNFSVGSLGSRQCEKCGIGVQAVRKVWNLTKKSEIKRKS